MSNLLDLLQIVQEPISLLIVVIYFIGTSLIYLIREILVNPLSVRRTLASLLVAILIIPVLIVARPYLPFRMSDFFFFLFVFMVSLLIFVLLMPPGGVGKSLIELIQYVVAPFIWLGRKLWFFLLAHRIITPVGLFILAFFIIVLIKNCQARPEPFRVNIELEKAGSAGDGSGADNLKSALDDLKSKLKDVYGIELIVNPVEDSADLTITLTLNNDDCRDKKYIPDQWRWDASDELEPILELLQLDEGGAHTEDEGNLCNWTRTKQDLESLILLAYGLETHYIRPFSPDTAAADIFRMAYSRLLYTEESENEKTPAQRDIKELALQRRMLTCARVMAVIADGAGLDIDEKKALKETVAKDPFEKGSPPADYCVAQAYYGLGRGEMEHHLQLLQENPERAPQALQDAVEYFDLALDTYAATTSSQPGDGFQWSYYFYRGLARYRLGHFERARQDLKIAEDSHEDTPINNNSLEAISYLRARIELEEILYSSLSAAVCSEPRPTGGRDERDPLSRLQQLQESDSMGLAPLNIGTMSLLSEAHYWQALALCDPKAEADHSRRAIEKAQAARLKIDGGTKNKGIIFEPSAVDVFLDHLYTSNDRNGNSASSVGHHLDQYNKVAGVPAYVIPLTVDSPWPLRWLVRNHFDEPLFDFSPLLAALGKPAVDSGCAGMFCAELGDGNGKTIEWPLIDQGYGLFEAHPSSGKMPSAIFTAEPGEKGAILLRSDLHTSLIYRRAEEAPIKIFTGLLSITTTAVLTAEVNAEWDGNAIDCHSCYEIDIDLQLSSEGYEISGLSTNGLDGFPTLIFKASLFEGTLPLDQQLSNYNHWRVIGGSFITLPIQDGNGRFKGSFGTILLDTTKHHAVRIFVEDRQGNEIVEFWVKDFEIKIPA